MLGLPPVASSRFRQRACGLEVSAIVTAVSGDGQVAVGNTDFGVGDGDYTVSTKWTGGVPAFLALPSRIAVPARAVTTVCLRSLAVAMGLDRWALLLRR